jgi:hypothetical protein
VGSGRRERRRDTLRKDEGDGEGELQVGSTHRETMSEGSGDDGGSGTKGRCDVAVHGTC